MLPAGALPALPADTQETFSRSGMAGAVEVTWSMADIVLIDTAPVGTDDDAVPLAGWSMMWCSSCV